MKILQFNTLTQNEKKPTSWIKYKSAKSALLDLVTKAGH